MHIGPPLRSRHEQNGSGTEPSDHFRQRDPMIGQDEVPTGQRDSIYG